MKININEIILKIKILDDKKTKAIITLDFGDFIVKGFTVAESNFNNRNGEKLWLKPPSYIAGGRYHPMFFMPDKNLWFQLEDKIWTSYKEQKDKHFKKRLGISDEDLLT